MFNDLYRAAINVSHAFCKIDWFSGHILESKGSVQYYYKRAHLDLLFQKKPIKYYCFKEKGHTSLVLQWAASDN